MSAKQAMEFMKDYVTFVLLLSSLAMDFVLPVLSDQPTMQNKGDASVMRD